MIPAVRQLLAPLHRRVMLMVNRAVLSAINDAGGVQIVQVQLLDGEVRDGVECFQQYGHASVPFAGAEGVMVSVGGSHDHGIVIAVEDRRYRLKNLAPGETALYDDQGQKVHLTRNGIVVDGAGKPITVQNTPHVDFNTPTVNMSGNLNVGGNIVAQGDITDSAAVIPKTMAGMRVAYNGHTHTDPQGGSVSTPSAGM